MKASQGLEIEKKYDVGDEAAVPAMESLPGVASVGQPHTAVLEAVYFDTAAMRWRPAASPCAAAQAGRTRAGT